MDANQVFYGYHEPRMAPDFFPTYKKVAFRGKVCGHGCEVLMVGCGLPRLWQIDMSDPEWARRVYVTEFKEPFYKGVRARAL